MPLVLFTRHSVYLDRWHAEFLCFCCNYFVFLKSQFLPYLFHSFLETSVPLLVLIEAAKAGNEKEVEDYAQVFTEHANKLVEVRDFRHNNTNHLAFHFFKIFDSDVMNAFAKGN